MQNSMKITSSLQDFNVVKTYEFSICYKIILWFFYNVQISTNYEKMILKFVVLFIALDRMGTIFPIDREKTHIRSYKKI